MQIYSHKMWVHEGKEKKHKWRDSQHEGLGEQQHNMSTKMGSGETQWMKTVREWQWQYDKDIITLTSHWLADKQQEKTWCGDNGKSKVRHWRHNETQVLTWHLIGNSPIRENREKYNHTQERERETMWMVSNVTKVLSLLMMMWHHRKTLTNTWCSCIHYRKMGSSSKRRRETSMTTQMGIRQCAICSSDGRSREEITIVRRRGESKGNLGTGKRLVQVEKGEQKT